MILRQAPAAAPDLEVNTVSCRRERSLLWREVKSANLFTGPAAFADFFTVGGGSVFYLRSDPSHWLILGRWKESSGVGIVWGVKGDEETAPALLLAAAERAADCGFARVITRPLSFTQAALYLAAGFRPWREITVFEMDAGTARPERPPRQVSEATLRSRRPGDTARVLEMDARAFDDFWSLDKYTLAGIAHAASVNAFRVALHGPEIAGYAIAGVTAGRGYLQRLGVDPGRQGHGLGRALAAWTLWWMRRNGAKSITVNTQSDNEPALRLYESLGFRRTGTDKYLFACEAGAA